MRTADFDYELPDDLIAQVPAPERDQSRLLVLHRSNGGLEHGWFAGLPQRLRSGDVLVLNDSKVIPARLRGSKCPGGGEVEMLLLEESTTNDWWALVRPAKRLRVGTRIRVATHDAGPSRISAEVVEKNRDGQVRLRFIGTADLRPQLDALGEVPLPPYIVRPGPATSPEDRARYQTVFAAKPDSVAAPTAGLHFTERVLAAIRARGVQIEFVTLHVGAGTFAPVRTARVEEHVMHAERFDVPERTSCAVNTAKASGRRVVAVGTTVVRVLESVAAENQGKLVPGSGRTRWFIHPPFRFVIVDALLTNFHLPRSTLLMLVSAFAAPGTVQGRELVLAAYAEAIRHRYRFYSYGDAMWIA